MERKGNSYTITQAGADHATSVSQSVTDPQREMPHDSEAFHEEKARLPTIFLSYARTDTAFVDRLEADLLAEGFSPWVDRQKLEGGKDWLDQIQEAIDQCLVVLVILSPDAVQSKHVRNEYRYALGQDKLVIPLEYHPPGHIPMDLFSLQRIVFQDTYSQGFSRLLKTLRGAGIPALPPPSTGS